MSTPTQNIDISAILSQEIAGYDEKIKRSGIIGSIVETLNENKDSLQSVLNSILERKGFISQADVDNAWVAIKKARKDEMDAAAKMYNRRFLIIGLGLVAVAAGIMAYVRYKNNKKN